MALNIMLGTSGFISLLSLEVHFQILFHTVGQGKTRGREIISRLSQ